ncbi:MAG: hypothetical protein PF692_04960 [Kiritimatiellae bacterium]|jgi:hypothetical protein|nr:hypothetical protein [Kiritimatiellia bacterium]
MKRNWSKFFTQYTVLLVVGTLVISGSLLYIDNKDKLTSKPAKLQEPKTITIKKTYKDDKLVNEYNDEDYNFEEQSNDEQYKSDEQYKYTETSYDDATTKKDDSQPANQLSVKTYQKTTTTKDSTNQKRGLNGRNPYAIEYANAIKKYIKLAARAEELKAKKKTASADDRYDIDNELRQMKPMQINLESKLKSAQKKYRAWESSH